MDAKKKITQNLDKLDEQFERLVSDDKLDVGNLENLLLDNLENYQQFLNEHTEDLLKTKIDEKKLINKKKKNGKKKVTY